MFRPVSRHSPRQQLMRAGRWGWLALALERVAGLQLRFRHDTCKLGWPAASSTY